MRNLTLKQLRAVHAIAERGKITNAAKELGLTGPAVTIQLKQIEEDVGLALFDRSSDGMRLTDAGRAVLESANAIEEQLRFLADQIDSLKGVRAGTLRLGAVSTAKYFAPRLIGAFMKEHPDIEILLQIGNRAETIERMRARELDIILMGRPPNDLPVRAAFFGDHPLVIIAPPDHPLAASRDISKKRVAEEKFLIRERGSGTRISLEIFFGDIPNRIDNLGIEMGSNETIKQAVMAGLGIAFISAHTIEAEVEAGRLVVLDVEGMPIRRQWFAVTRTDHAISPAMLAFQDFLMRRATPHLPLIGKLYPAAEH